MAINKSISEPTKPRKAVIKWLLDSDPSIRWQVLRDLTDASTEVIATERSRITGEGWGARLLSLQDEDGMWSHASDRKWESTLHTLQLLRVMGMDPESEPARAMVRKVREKVTWGEEFGNSPFFEGEVEPCINGSTLGIGSHFGEASDRLAQRLLSEQLEDGGWNCDAPKSQRSSFHSTICVLEGLLGYEKAKGAAAAVTAARNRAHDYLLDRQMLRRLSNGEVIDRKWTQFSFPTTWHYDVLRGLDYMRAAGVERDQRIVEAIQLVANKQHQNGRWPLQNPHPVQVIDMEAGRGKASRWNTLRALRVLKWYAE